MVLKIGRGGTLTNQKDKMNTLNIIKQPIYTTATGEPIGVMMTTPQVEPDVKSTEVKYQELAADDAKEQAQTFPPKKIKTYVHAGTDDDEPSFLTRKGSLGNLFGWSYTHSPGLLVGKMLTYACKWYDLSPDVCYLVDVKDPEVKLAHDIPLMTSRRLIIKMTKAATKAQREKYTAIWNAKEEAKDRDRVELAKFEATKRQLFKARQELDIMETMFNTKHEAYLARSIFEARGTKILDCLIKKSADA